MIALDSVLRTELCVKVDGRGLTSSPLLEFFSNLLDVGLFVQVCGDEVGFALTEGIELFARLFAGFCVARGYIDGCAVLDEAFADHAADAFCTAGDEHDLALCILSVRIEMMRDCRLLALTSKRLELSILFKYLGLRERGKEINRMAPGNVRFAAIAVVIRRPESWG